MDRISKGIEIKSDGKIMKAGGSLVVIVPPNFVKTSGLTDGSSCRIFQNNKGQLILDFELSVSAGGDTRRKKSLAVSQAS